MKYIKRYNEAIGPKLTRKVYDEETGVTQSVPSVGFGPAKFREAGSLASQSNQAKKADVLRDYADEKEFGYYNLTVLKSRTGYLMKNVKVTDLKIQNVRYGVPGHEPSSSLLSGISVENLIDRWKNGLSNGKLGITFDVSFRILNSSKRQLADGTNGMFQLLSKTYNWIPFSISLVLSNNSYGVDDFLRCPDCDGNGVYHCYECDDNGEIDGEKCPDCDGKGPQECDSCKGSGILNSIWVNGEQVPIEKDENGNPIYDVQSFFDDTKKFTLEMSPKDVKNDTYTAVFSDKRSAIEFTKDLPKAIAQSTDFRKKLTDLLGILSHDPSQDLNDSMKVFTKVSNNKLFPENPQPNETFYNSYFYKKIAQI
jgi:hypothetical protein